ncbi:hypothetical protein GGR57DRAFT_477009 [Xylariaceae sp. FL1272]|nr:hypothetical protein GGR57DRAFT_477009 [Xylariaceae sp. FL1272]
MLRLSSAHLRLASPYFMKALSGTWKEASIGPDGLRHLHAEDWDKEALLILMRIIHGRNRPVPRVMDLERLAKIAVLVDYYKCYEVVEPFAEIWRQAVEVSLPVDVGRELVLYLFTSWVFRWQNIFEIVTKTAMEGCKEPLPRLGIPIPLPLIEVIDRERREHINEIIIVLRDLLGHFRDGCAPCSFECSSILLGALTKELYARGLEPPPEPSYSGHSYASTMHAVSSIRSPKWRPTWSGSFGNREPHACDLASIIQSKIGGLGPLKGLRLCDLLDHAPVYML